jgi:hypothetical protein
MLIRTQDLYKHLEKKEGKLDYYAKSELEGYKQLREGGCKSMPALLGYKK